jgi:hypothetical protein
MRDGKSFSLVGYSKRQDGEVVAHLIFADSDSQMHEKARAALRLRPTTCFALIGEGTFGTPEGPRPALLAYLQNAEFTAPIQLYRCYRRNAATGKIEFNDGWRNFRQLSTSWL